MSVLECVLIYFLVALPLAMFFGRWLAAISKYYPEVNDWEPRE
jgi:hypothetical protein